MESYRIRIKPISGILFFFLLEVFSVFNSNCFAQIRVINGTVFNAITNKPVSGIRVAVKGYEGSTYTDPLGEYKIALPDTLKSIVFTDFEGVDLIEVKSISPEVFDIYVSQVNMKELSVAELMNIKISTAGKQEQKKSDIPASIVVITRKDIENAGYKDLNEILENIPGFYSLGNAYNEGGTNFGVRGFSSGGALSDFMIMVNGVNRIQDFSNSYSTDKILVPVEAIERIEVVRGANAVLYGSAAFMGAVNIITIGDFEKNKSSATFLAGSNQTYKGSAHITKEIDGLKFVLNASIVKTNGLDAKYSDMQSDTNLIKSWGLSPQATTKGQLGGLQKYFELSAKYKGLSMMMLVEDNEQGTPGSIPSANTHGGFLLKTFNYTAFVGYEKQISKKLKLNAKGSYYGFDQKGDPHFIYAQSYNLFQTRAQGFDIEVSTLYKPVEQFDIIAGVNNHTALDAGRTIDISTSPILFRNFSYGIAENDNMVTNAVFTQMNLRLFKKLLFVAGIRAEQTDPFAIKASYGYTQNVATNKDTTLIINVGTMAYDKVQWIPRAALIYQINPKNVVKLMFGQSKKRPSILEEVNIGSRTLNGLKFAGMQSLELEYSSVITSYYSVSVNAYYNELKKLVLRNVVILPNGNIVTQSSNAGEDRTYGISINNKIIPIKNLSIEFQMVYQNSSNKTENYPSEASYSPNFLGYFNVNYTVKKLNFCLYGTYVDQMKSGWNINRDPTKSAWYGKDVPAYMKLNFNIRVNDIWKGVFASFHITNLLNSTIRYPTTPNSTWTDQGMLGFGRMYQFNIGCKF